MAKIIDVTGSDGVPRRVNLDRVLYYHPTQIRESAESSRTITGTLFTFGQGLEYRTSLTVEQIDNLISEG